MAKARPKFDSSHPKVVARNFTCNGKELTGGEDFDLSSVSVTVQERLWRARRIINKVEQAEVEPKAKPKKAKAKKAASKKSEITTPSDETKNPSDNQEKVDFRPWDS